ncbi:hypothetical protein TNCV_3769751 [Trichonephila clavipes]|nr:hypothetical protein TNCV_3769751 [Trichonephila clavipes]
MRTKAYCAYLSLRGGHVAEWSRYRIMAETSFTLSGQYYFRTILDRVLGARAAGVHYRLISVWTLVPVRLGKQLSDHSTVDDFASEAADCRHTYTMENCPQRR